MSPVCSQQPRHILQLVLACWRGWLRATCPVMQILRLSRLTRYCSSGSQARLFLNHCSVPHRLLPSSVVQLLSSWAPRHHEAAALPPPPRARGPHGSGHPRQVSDAEGEGRQRCWIPNKSLLLLQAERATAHPSPPPPLPPGPEPAAVPASSPGKGKSRYLEWSEYLHSYLQQVTTTPGPVFNLDQKTNFDLAPDGYILTLLLLGRLWNW